MLVSECRREQSNTDTSADPRRPVCVLQRAVVQRSTGKYKEHYVVQHSTWWPKRAYFNLPFGGRPALALPGALRAEAKIF